MPDDQYVTPRPEWGRGAGDRDQVYTFGRHPLTYLRPDQYARLQLRFPRPEQELE